jgi:hypothetical protein
MPGIVHIASNTITMEGQYVRQRCVWCGVLLIDIDLSMTATSDGKEPGSWATGALVEVDGGHSSLVEGNRIPDNCCYCVNPLEVA